MKPLALQPPGDVFCLVAEPGFHVPRAFCSGECRASSYHPSGSICGFAVFLKATDSLGYIVRKADGLGCRGVWYGAGVKT